MDLKEFNFLLDKWIKQEQAEANKRLSSVSETLSKKIITTVLDDTIEKLELLRLLPLYYQGGIKRKEELEFYKEVKLRKLEKEIERVKFNCENPTCSILETDLDLKQVLRNLEKDKEFIEEVEWDGEQITLPESLENESFFFDQRKIRKMFVCDIRELDNSLKYFYQQLSEQGFLYLISNKIIESEKAFNKYLYYMNFIQDFKELQQKGIHTFSFSETKHLKFLEPFFSLYPMVSEKMFRQVCDDPRMNEFCGNENVNHVFEQERMKNQQKAINNSDYEIYINTHSMVKDAYNKYSTNYSPFENAEKFLNHKEAEFQYFVQDYVKGAKKFKEFVMKFLKGVPSNRINISSKFDFKRLNQYRNYDNGYEIDAIIRLSEAIKEFESKYHLTNSVLDNWKHKDCVSLLDSVSKEIGNEFASIRKELNKVQQELKEIHETMCKIDLNFNLLLFEREDLKEIEKIISESFRSELDDLEMKRCTQFGLAQMADIEQLASRYSIVFVDFILSRSYPDVRDFYYRDASKELIKLASIWGPVVFDGMNHLIDYSKFESFKPKMKILDKKI